MSRSIGAISILGVQPHTALGSAGHQSELSTGFVAGNAGGTDAQEAVLDDSAAGGN